MAEDEEVPVPYKLLLPQALVGLVDSISFMIIAPSLIFYVLQQGGTKEQYGIILSAFSFSSFLLKPVLGMWSDRAGNKFRAPYLASIFVAMLGGALYLIASLWTGNVSITLILLGRLLGGAGAANSTLGFTYIAQVIPKEHMTKANSLLSMVRIAGMMVGPAVNGLLGNVNAKFLGLTLDPFNSVGLVLICSNLLGYFVLYFMLEEPPEAQRHSKEISAVADNHPGIFVKALAQMDILIALLVVFGLNANFQLLETGLAPAASDALGWVTTTISALFAGNAVLILFAFIATFKLSAMGVKDIQMIKIGLLMSAIGYGLIYQCWRHDVSELEFVFPILFCTLSYPFLGAPTRSVFTVAVANSETLAGHQGTMQALMSMTASVAGFAAPDLIAAYILRSPDEVADSDDERELTYYALFAPILSLITYFGVVYVEFAYPEVTCKTPAETEVEEQQALLGNAEGDDVDPGMVADRRNIVTLMHIPQVSFHHDIDDKPSTISKI
ncbi:hypothetical protein MPSEU_000485400 [Mayamaea pseudoterrestris]|nr:hypothetical protein MPSEU_000485400 [Mayamaea pseudoterrestris]